MFAVSVVAMGVMYSGVYRSWGHPVDQALVQTACHEKPATWNEYGIIISVVRDKYHIGHKKHFCFCLSPSGLKMGAPHHCGTWYLVLDLSLRLASVGAPPCFRFRARPLPCARVLLRVKQDVLGFSFAIHHAGLPKADRALVEDLYLGKQIQVTRSFFYPLVGHLS